jgi:hypothetical protein
MSKPKTKPSAAKPSAKAPAKGKAAPALPEGVHDSDQVEDDGYARVLLLGPPKAGKSSCIAATAPAPVLVINCDGRDALLGAARVRRTLKAPKFLAIDVDSVASLKRAVSVAERMVRDEQARTVVLDTASLLVDTLINEITLHMQGWDAWRELHKVVMQAVDKLRALDAHLFVVCHMTADADNAAGMLPAIGGKLKVTLPARLSDWVLLDVQPGRRPERMFLLGPQDKWTYSGRHMRRSTAIDADVGLLLEEFGIEP